MRTTTSKTHTKKETTDESPDSGDSSVLEEADAFLDEVDQLLEDQEVLVAYRQRSGQ